MAASEMQTDLIPVDLIAEVIAQIEVVKTRQKKVRVGTHLFDLASKAIIKISQVVATLIPTAKPAKAAMKYGLVVEDKAESIKNLAKLNQVLDEFEVEQQQFDQQALVLAAELNNAGGLNEI